MTGVQTCALPIYGGYKSNTTTTQSPEQISRLASGLQKCIKIASEQRDTNNQLIEQITEAREIIKNDQKKIAKQKRILLERKYVIPTLFIFSIA